MSLFPRSNYFLILIRNSQSLLLFLVVNLINSECVFFSRHSTICVFLRSIKKYSLAIRVVKIILTIGRKIANHSRIVKKAATTMTTTTMAMTIKKKTMKTATTWNLIDFEVCLKSEICHIQWMHTHSGIPCACVCVCGRASRRRSIERARPIIQLLIFSFHLACRGRLERWWRCCQCVVVAVVVFIFHMERSIARAATIDVREERNDDDEGGDDDVADDDGFVCILAACIPIKN